ncbi:serine/threonine protein kinase [Microbacterium protaetiae]|uniref:non-specific serine/threonine protein kinase n=1 Tax=Microbacterium protaetiae TaxID=2509458 RepID=A0A4P6EDA5_9MICO|nr:serine/threonine-protein kinase [Microbacterium protaetiae]QAY60235.1 serine/threonine protein kinase [Microbacterium protaetiae]
MPKRLPSDPPVLPGLTYVRPLGSGGFADVFLYAQDMPRRQVAVKVLPTGIHEAELVRMFNAEADILAHLSAHPSIVTVYQAGISADGRPYIVMEYCPGSLAQRYRRERLPLDEVLTTGVKMAGAVETAHRAGLIHRDIKPSNILITTFGSPVLADFGISASLAPRNGEEVLAMSVPWSAPEVIAEQTSGTVASEVWGLGATVYSLLAGHSPFERAEPGQNGRDQLRRRILRASFPPMRRPDVPAQVLEVLAVAMSRDPRDRYPSALAFAQALRDVQYTLGFPPTPLEVAVEEWVPGDQTVDFGDAAARGPQISSVPHTSRRRATAPTPLTARDEDTDISSPQTVAARRIWPWLVVGAVACAAAVLVVWAVASGGVG